MRVHRYCPCILLAGFASGVGLASAPGIAQDRTADRVPSVVASFLDQLDSTTTNEQYHLQAKESLWSVYPQADSLRITIESYVLNASINPGVAYAGLCLIAFHDPRSVRPLVQRALSNDTDPATRWYLLNTAPYILGMGDVFYMGDGNLSDETRRFANDLLELGDSAVVIGVGRLHAARLRQLYEQGKKDEQPDSDWGLAVWHLSAYLVGTLDLRDEATLGEFLNPDHGAVFANLMGALSYAAGRDFLATLRNRRSEDITREDEVAAANTALDWWQSYLSNHPGGEWLYAAIDGLNAAGYAVDLDLSSSNSMAELQRALEADDPIARYTAYRLLNHMYDANFDLDRVFLADKYAMGFLYPSPEDADIEERLRSYWTERLAR